MVMGAGLGMGMGGMMEVGTMMRMEAVEVIRPAAATAASGPPGVDTEVVARAIMGRARVRMTARVRTTTGARVTRRGRAKVVRDPTDRTS
jgi:hypothetical protein